MPKTATEIINETVEFYSVDPVERRAVGSVTGACYISRDGRACAYGRCMTEEAKLGSIGFAGGGPMLPEDHRDSYMLDDYKGQTGNFWDDLQKLHDDPLNWTASGLSPTGKLYASHLLIKYANA